ncbi:uncharacterized protein LOC126821051 [Patella vulgata]|uniref:uncharacterized protein LOC126821051 n=1 Tax=Patella vulgata TaxID=6465 RepID=UPI00217FA329|nr:uncharacterized protein LOC126821051 [Patella vulgata]XP_050405305.1 uncharacterized protein LOC126821051 [Patella vulgata]
MCNMNLTRTINQRILQCVSLKPVCLLCMKTLPIRFKTSKPSRSDLAKLIFMDKELNSLYGPKIESKNKVGTKSRKTTKINKKVASLGIIGESLQDVDMSSKNHYDEGILIDNSYLNVNANSNCRSENQRNSVFNSLLSIQVDPGIKSYKEINKALNSKKEGILPKVIDPNDPLNFVLNYPLIPNTPEGSVEFERFNTEVDKFCLQYPPSVSKILNKTMSAKNRYFLERWKKKMIEEMGEEGFKQHQEETLRKGINFHACVQQLLAGESESDIQIQPNVEAFWRSIQPIFNEVTEVKALECSITHPYLLYKGVFDCVALYRDTLCVIDWKTSRKPKPLLTNTYDNPLQVAAYLGAINACTDPLLKIGPVSNAVIVVAYSWGDPAHVHFLNSEKCHRYWSQWLERLDLYWRTLDAPAPE